MCWNLNIVDSSILHNLYSSDTNRKISALSKLAQTSDEVIIEKIISLLDDDEIRIRGEAFSTLFQNKNDISVKLIDGLHNPSKNIRAFCSIILANRNDKNAINSIIKLVTDSSDMVRSCAFGSLGYLRAKKAKKEIHHGVFDSNIEAKKSAAYALILINEDFSVQERKELEGQKDPDFKKILEKNYK